MSKNNDKQKIKQVIDLLKFILTLDDKEITEATIVSIIEILEETLDCQ